jgi:hypothetical protein
MDYLIFLKSLLKNIVLYIKKYIFANFAKNITLSEQYVLDT